MTVHAIFITPVAPAAAQSNTRVNCSTHELPCLAGYSPSFHRPRPKVIHSKRLWPTRRSHTHGPGKKLMHSRPSPQEHWIDDEVCYTTRLWRWPLQTQEPTPYTKTAGELLAMSSLESAWDQTNQSNATTSENSIFLARPLSKTIWMR